MPVVALKRRCRDRDDFAFVLDHDVPRDFADFLRQTSEHFSAAAESESHSVAVK